MEEQKKSKDLQSEETLPASRRLKSSRYWECQVNNGEESPTSDKKKDVHPNDYY